VTFKATSDGNVRAFGRLTDELRAAIRANKPTILVELAAATDADFGAPVDPETDRRRARVLAMLAEHPSRLAFVVEPGAPPILGVAIPGVAYGEIELPTDYDPVLLLGLIERHSRTVR
jgi:hypothetical protein